MGYACYERNGRDQGYDVPAICDHPGCNARIDRGIGYACGGDPMDHCGLFFCDAHRSHETPEGTFGVCERCTDPDLPSFARKADVRVWLRHKMNDKSWADWRKKNPAFCAENEIMLRKKKVRAEGAGE